MSYSEDITPEDSIKESANKILNAHISGDVVVVVGVCTVDYSGRAAKYLDIGNRCVTINPDGSLLVNSPKSVKPQCWQPSDAEISVDINEDNDLIIRADRTSPEESLVVIFEDVVKSIHYEPTEDEVTVDGSEDEMHKYIMRNPSILGENIDVVENEKEVSTGKIDIFGYKNESPVVVEVKRRKAQLKHIDQLKRYVDTIDDTNTIGILVAPDITESAKELLKKHNYRFVSLSPIQVMD